MKTALVLVLLFPMLARSMLSISHEPFQYADEYTDPESHLQYLSARYYSAGLMRFVSVDRYPDLKKELFDNTYNYAGGNPVRYHDPNGHCFIDSFIEPLEKIWSLGDRARHANISQLINDYALIPIDFEVEAEAVDIRLFKQEKNIQQFTAALERMDQKTYVNTDLLLKDIRKEMVKRNVKRAIFNIYENRIEFKIYHLTEPIVLNFERIPINGQTELGYKISMLTETSDTETDEETYEHIDKRAKT